MVPAPVTVGSLVFFGPAHVPGLAEFRYARVVSTDGEEARITIIAPGGDAEDHPDPVAVSVLRRHLVAPSEGELWPGDFVGRPVAFVQPEGTGMDQWMYGVVTGYRMTDREPWLHLQYMDQSCKIVLTQQPNVVKVDWLNYALQTGSGMNVAVLTPEDMLDRFDEIRGLCSNSRSAVPTAVTKLLSRPFDAVALVPVIRPDTLAIVTVPRQHIYECSLKKKSKKGSSLFEAPAGKITGKRRVASAPTTRPTTRRKLISVHEDSSDDSDIEAPESRAPEPGADYDNEKDAREVQHQNQTFEDNQPACQTAFPGGGLDSRSGSTFRPSGMEQQLNAAIAHPDYAGKDAHFVLECVQQACNYHFKATPPVLRAAYEFGFHIRGLSVTHFQRVTPAMLLKNTGVTVNMSDFSRKNNLHAAPEAASHKELVDMLTCLRQFGRRFYNVATVSVLETAVAFVEGFGEGVEPDQDTVRILVLWLNLKLCKFRSLVMTSGLNSAIRVQDEFSLSDPELASLLHTHQQLQIAALTAQLAKRPGKKPSGPSASHEGSRNTNQPSNGGVPKAVLRGLPKKGSLGLCLKHLSKVGCTGNGEPGQCFSAKRAHFRPEVLPANAKKYIETAFGGLADEFADL